MQGEAESDKKTESLSMYSLGIWQNDPRSSYQKMTPEFHTTRWVKSYIH